MLTMRSRFLCVLKSGVIHMIAPHTLNKSHLSSPTYKKLYTPICSCLSGITPLTSRGDKPLTLTLEHQLDPTSTSGKRTTVTSFAGSRKILSKSSSPWSVLKLIPTPSFSLMVQFCSEEGIPRLKSLSEWLDTG